MRDSKYNSRVYALVNTEDTGYAKEVIRCLSPIAKDRILEIGCGRGFVIKKIQETVPNTYGVDINPEAITRGVAKNLQVMNAEHLKFDDKSFDKVFSFHTIEHVPDIKKMTSEIERVLKPGGMALIVYPAELIRGMFSMHAALILLKNPFRSREIHLHKVTPKKIQTLIENTSLKHVKSRFSLFLSSRSSLFISPQYVTILEKSRFLGA